MLSAWRSRVAAAAAVAFVGCWTAAVAQPDGEPTNPGAPADGVETVSAAERAQIVWQRHLASFDQVWETVREKAWDPEFDLAGWQQQRDRWRPRIEAGTSREEVRQVLGNLLDWLGQSHFAVLPGELYEPWPEDDGSADEAAGDTQAAQQGDANAGLEVRLVEGIPTVFRVIPGSDAAAQGIQPGWQLREVSGKTLDPWLQTLKESLGERSVLSFETAAALAMEQRLAGKPGTKKPLVLLDHAGQQKALAVTLTQPLGQVVRFGNLPPTVLRCEHHEVAEGVGYVRFNCFFSPQVVMHAVGEAIELARQGTGLIVDLRGNPGGLVGMTMGIGNRLVSDKKQFLGILKTKETELRITLIPAARPYLGPVAVLVDECSASSSEILAGGLQAIGRARVFGRQTAGAALPSAVVILPNGDRFQYAFASYVDAGLRCIEGQGVAPDEVVHLQRQGLLDGDDACLSAALAWIRASASGT